MPARQSLSGFPNKIGPWRGQEASRLDERILKELAVDDYLNRLYQADGRPLVSLYIGYYESQRSGHTFHSPMNCLPGSGWNPVNREHVTIPIAGIGPAASAAGTRLIEVNRVLIQKGLDSQVVFYWYQSRGRVVASEYRAKLCTVADSIRINRTDGALVRVIVPVRALDRGSEVYAEGEALVFIESLFPLLNTFVPI